MISTVKYFCTCMRINFVDNMCVRICFHTSGFVLLQNTDVLALGIERVPYAVLLDAFVPYLSDNQPKVRTYIICMYAYNMAMFGCVPKVDFCVVIMRSFVSFVS